MYKRRGQGLKRPFSRLIRRAISASFILASLACGVFFVRTLIPVATKAHSKLLALWEAKPQAVTYVFDSIYSTSLQNNILAECQNFCAHKKISATLGTELFSHLQKKFPLIEDLIVDTRNPETAVFTIKGAHPFLRLNNQVVTKERRQLFDEALFEDYGELLPRMYSKSSLGDDLPTVFHTFLKTIPTELLTSYSVVIKSPDCVTLTPTLAHNRYSIIADPRTLTDRDKVLCAANMYQDAILKKVLKQPHKKKWWVFDIRYDQQVIVRTEEKGVGV